MQLFAISLWVSALVPTRRTQLCTERHRKWSRIYQAQLPMGSAPMATTVTQWKVSVSVKAVSVAPAHVRRPCIALIRAGISQHSDDARPQFSYGEPAFSGRVSAHHANQRRADSRRQDRECEKSAMPKPANSCLSAAVGCSKFMASMVVVRVCRLIWPACFTAHTCITGNVLADSRGMCAKGNRFIKLTNQKPGATLSTGKN